MTTASATLLGGIDIGGTKIGVAVGDVDGRVVARDRFDSDPSRDPADLLDEAIERLHAIVPAGASFPNELGVAAPGPLSYEQGMLLEVPNMPRWQFFPLMDHLRSRFDGGVSMMNDANASVLAEAYWGAATGTRSAIFLTMSTGMGAGLWLNGDVYEGPTALAGEIGHIRLHDDGPVGFGKRGSVEGYLSGPGIVQVAQAEALVFRQRGVATRLPCHSATPVGQELSPELICNLAREGDDAAVRVIDRCGEELGRLCALLVDLLNPEVIILGTIGSAHLDLFAPRALQVVKREALPAAVERVKIVASGLNDRGNQTAIAIAQRARTRAS